jgi:hypothetical protein
MRLQRRSIALFSSCILRRRHSLAVAGEPDEPERPRVDQFGWRDDR